MKTINSTLLAAQKQPAAARPIARASLADNGRLHPAIQFTDSYAGGYCRTANCGTFFVRVRTVPVGTKLQYQKITDPTVEAQWEAWSDLDTNLAGSLNFGLFWTGTYVVATYQDATDLRIKYRRTTDGTSWSVEADAYTGISPNAARIFGADGGASQSGIFVSHGNQLYWGAYNPAADTWTALSSAGLSVLAGPTHGDAFYDSTNSRHVLLHNPNQLFAFSRLGIVVSSRTTGGLWTHHRVFIQSDNLGCANISVSKTQIGGLWWASFTILRAWGSSIFWLACSDDGLYWEAPASTAVTASGMLNIVGTFTGVTGTWLANDIGIYLSTPQTYWSLQPVVRYDFTAGSSTARVGGGRAPHLTVIIQANGLTTPALNSVLTLERGFTIAGTDYFVSAGVYYVTGFRYLLDGNLLEIQAIDTIGLLTTYVSDTAFNFTSHTVKSLVEAICALAGVHACTFDAAALWSDTITTFTHPANENARVSLEALRERVPFDYYVTEVGAVAFYLPGAAPAVTYTYGRAAGNHVYWPGEFGADNVPTYVRVIGTPARTIGGEDAADSAIASAGRRFTMFILDSKVKTTVDADELAGAWLLFLQERARAGYFEAPPNFSLEIGDVIAFSGAASVYEAAAGNWRVEQIQELFNPPNTKKFVQRIHLRGTT
jgi:hypothetical protein